MTGRVHTAGGQQRSATVGSPRAGNETLEALAELVRRSGGIVALLMRALVALVTPPFSWWREFARQYVFIVKTCLIPIIIVQFAFGAAALGLTVENYLDALGAVDRAPVTLPLALLRDFGIFLTAAVVAGVVGTSMTAELGARQIRDELDALRVMGVDPVREMVAPRLLALVVAQVVLLMVSLVAGALAVYLSVTVVFHASGGPFVEQFVANTGILDVYGALGKSLVFGFLIGAICCYKGLHVSGGAEGVGRAVNEAVVSSLLWIFFVSALYTMVFLSLFPDASVFR